MNNIIFKLYGQFDITYDAKFVPTRNDLEYIKFCDNLKHGYSENIIEFKDNYWTDNNCMAIMDAYKGNNIKSIQFMNKYFNIESKIKNKYELILYCCKHNCVNSIENLLNMENDIYNPVKLLSDIKKSYLKMCLNHDNINLMIYMMKTTDAKLRFEEDFLYNSIRDANINSIKYIIKHFRYKYKNVGKTYVEVINGLFSAMRYSKNYGVLYNIVLILEKTFDNLFTCDQTNIDAKELFNKSIEHGHLDLVKHFEKYLEANNHRFGEEYKEEENYLYCDCKYSLNNAVEKNYIDVVEYMYNTYNLTEDMIEDLICTAIDYNRLKILDIICKFTTESIINHIINNDNFETFKFIHKKLELTNGDYIIKNVNTIKYSSNPIQYLEYLKFKKEDVIGIFNDACIYKKYKLIHYLVNNYNMDRHYIINNLKYIMKFIFPNFKTLFNKYNFTKEEIYKDNLITLSIIHNNIDTFKLLNKIYNISNKYLYDNLGYIIINISKWGNKVSLEYLCNLLNLERKHIEIYINKIIQKGWSLKNCGFLKYFCIYFKITVNDLTYKYTYDKYNKLIPYLWKNDRRDSIEFLMNHYKFPNSHYSYIFDGTNNNCDHFQNCVHSEFKQRIRVFLS